MQLNVSCPHCGEKFSVSSQYAGKAGNCKKCGNKFTVPIPEAKLEVPEAAMQSPTVSGAASTPAAAPAPAPSSGVRGINSLVIGMGGAILALLIVVAFMALRGEPDKPASQLAAVPSLPAPATPVEVASEPVADIAPAATQATPAPDYKAMLEEAEVAARDRRWADALAAFERVRKNDPGSIEPVDALRFASVYAITGDFSGHEDLCRWLYARFPAPSDLGIAEQTAKAYVLAPSANKPDLLREAEKRARFAVQKVGSGGKPWLQVALGMAQFRLGNYAQASQMLAPAKNLDNPVIRTLAISYDAMAQFRQGNAAQAAEALKRARDEFAQLPGPGTEMYDGGWHDILTSEMMLKEAEEAIGDVQSFADPLQAAEAAARDRRWADALAAFEAVRKNDPGSIEPIHGLRFAAVYAVTGDFSAHEDLCRWLYARFPAPSDLGIAEQTAKAYVLAPSANKPDLLREAEKRARFAVQKVGSGGKPWLQVALGMAQYRLGNYAQASQMLAPAKNLDNPVIRTLAISYDAMAQFRQGNAAQAAEALKRARDEFAQLPGPGTETYDGGWHDILTSEMMLKEAEEAIGGM